MYTKKDVDQLAKDWITNPRWKDIHRPYQAEDVIRLRGSRKIDYTAAREGAELLWKYLSDKPFIRALGAMTGTQAVQMVEAGLEAIYVSGWQVAGDMNDAHETYPDQSLYPVQSVPHLIRRIQNAFTRRDEIDHMQNKINKNWFQPIVADAEAGFGGPLNTLELVKSMIKEGVSGIHLEDQLSSLKKCGHMGGKVLVPTQDFVEKLIAARFAMDLLGVPTVLIARTDAQSASFIRADSNQLDHDFITGERTAEGLFVLKAGIDYAIKRALAYAPYADIIWCETSTPDLDEAKAFADGVHKQYPNKWLAYNCSPSFNWKKHLSETELKTFQEKLGAMGYKFQFVTLAGFHAINASMFELANNYAKDGMLAYSKMQEEEFALEKAGYKAAKHQSFVGVGYFDEVLLAISDQKASTTALKGSTEEAQF
jgi:isocitrate lyase